MKNLNLDEDSKLAEIQLKKAQSKEIMFRVKESENRKLIVEEQQINIDKIRVVKGLLESYTVDGENQIGSEVRFTRVFDEAELKKLKSKLFMLMARL